MGHEIEETIVGHICHKIKKSVSGYKDQRFNYQLKRCCVLEQDFICIASVDSADKRVPDGSTLVKGVCSDL